MENEEVLDNGVPNVAFGNMCANHFFSLTSPFAGNPGIYVLGKIVSSSEEQFEDYLASQQQADTFEIGQ